jgi:hypothetical protein
MMRSEPIEWVIERTHKGETFRHSEGAQTIFSHSRAKKIAKLLGPAWSLRNLNEGKEEQ